MQHDDGGGVALWQRENRLVASPALLQAHGLAAPLLPADLAHLPSLDEGPSQREHSWSLLGPAAAVAVVQYQPRMISDDRVALRLAALQGVGVLQLPTMMVRNDLQQGTLVDLLPQWRPRAGIVHAVFPSRRGLLPAVRKLIEFMALEFARLTLAEQGESPAPAPMGRAGASHGV